MKKTVLVISNITTGLVLFRKELIHFLSEEYRVVVIAENTGLTEEFISLGCEFVDLKLNRHGTNPVEDIKLEQQYKHLIKKYNPFIVLTYTIKPNIYGGLACKSLKIPYIANVTGLGDSIENSGLLSKIARQLYKRGLKGAYKVFFQNQTNCNFFLQNRLYAGRYGVLPGSGVNLEKHPFEEYPPLNSDSCIQLCVVGRITRDKGIQEVIDASYKFNPKQLSITLIGNCEGDYLNKIEEAENHGVIRYVGSQNNVHEWMKENHAILHASYHEGMSNVLLEAAACGRPIIATNVAGCREAFDEGVSGIGFEPKNVDSLIGAIEKFLALPAEKKQQMGIAGRKKMEEYFDRTIIVNQYIKSVKEVEGKLK